MGGGRGGGAPREERWRTFSTRLKDKERAIEAEFCFASSSSAWGALIIFGFWNCKRHAAACRQSADLGILMIPAHPHTCTSTAQVLVYGSRYVYDRAHIV